MKSIRFLAAAACLLASFAWVCRADDVDDLVNARMKKGGIPGLSLAVVHEGKLVKTGAYGFANLELQAPAKVETVYEIGSITKQFTAMLAMMLVEDGSLRLEDPITRHLDGIPDAWKDVTVKHLLNHTSGIVSYTGVTDFVTLARTDHKPAEIIALVKDKPFEFKPGTSWAYNNSGYFLLGLVLEKASGKKYADLLKERILEPLGLKVMRPNNPRAIIPNRAEGYGKFLGITQNRDGITPTAAFSAGFLVSDVGDMVAWDKALREAKLISASSYEQMYARTKLDDDAKSTRPYGFGWAIGDRNGRRLIEHGGGTAGFSTVIARFVDDQLTVIVLTNLAGADAPGIAHAIAGKYVPSLSLASIPAKPDPNPKRSESMKRIVSEVIGGRLDLSDLTPQFAKFLSTPAARETGKRLAAEGPINEFTFLDEQPAGKNTSLKYRASTGKATHIVTIILNDEGRVSGLRLETSE